MKYSEASTNETSAEREVRLAKDRVWGTNPEAQQKAFRKALKWLERKSNSRSR